MTTPNFTTNALNWSPSTAAGAPIDWTEISNEAPLQSRFSKLASEWYRETGDQSSVIDRRAHRAYRDIIDLGVDVVPLILAELRRCPDQWFDALRTLTNENPVQPNQRGKVSEMAEAWLAWGRQKNLIA